MFPRYRSKLLLALLAALMLPAMGVASAAPADDNARLEPAPALRCHLDGSRVEYTRGPAARAIAIASAHCVDDRPAKLGIELVLEEFDGEKVGPKVRELCANDSDCVAETSAPRKRGETYCLYAILFYSEPSGGEIKSDTSERCDDPPTSSRSSDPETGGAIVPAEPVPF